MYWAIKVLALLIPTAYWVWLLTSGSFANILHNKNVSLFWMIWGTAAQVVFISRFFYQWIHSENRKESLFPLGFWIISTCGSLMIFTFSVIRLDPVLFAAHSLGLFTYIRNISLHYGKSSLFDKLNKIPVLNKVIGKVSDKIK